MIEKYGLSKTALGHSRTRRKLCTATELNLAVEHLLGSADNVEVL